MEYFVKTEGRWNAAAWMDVIYRTMKRKSSI